MSGNIKYFDAHCHLQDKRIIDSIDDIILQMRKNSVFKVVCNGTSPDDWAAVNHIAEKYDEVLPAYGLHPWYLKVSDDWKDILIQFLKACNYSSVGECGFDKNADFSYKLQKSIFYEHIDIANQLSKPISIHCVKAYNLLWDSLNSVRFDIPIIIHSFSSSVEMMKQLCKLNVFFSFSGTIVRRNSKYINVLREVPRERILFETDSPDLLPVSSLLSSEVDENNVPSNVVAITEFAAEVLGIEIEELAEQVENNFERVFK